MCFLHLFSPFQSGRRPRTVAASAAAASKGQLKLKKDSTTTTATRRKVASGQQMACDSTIQKITQRTRNLRKSLHKIQKQFDNQAITKFFQRTLKAHSCSRSDGGDDSGSSSSGAVVVFGSGDSGNDNNSTSNDNDEIECDVTFANNEEEHLNNLCENNTVEDGILPNVAPMQIDGAPAIIPNRQLFDVVHAHNDDVVMMMNQTVTDDVDVETIDQSCSAMHATSDAFTTATAHAHAPHSIQSTNIFLQKPVLHLNIDQSTLMQTKSIVINKHLDACPNFATSFPAFLNASVSNNNNNNNNSTTANNLQHNNDNNHNKSSEDESSAEWNEMNGSANRRSTNGNKLKGHSQKCDKQKLRKRRPRKCANKWSDSRQNDAIDSDSNSCDSGVVSDRSFEVSSTDSNKPTTPHRIVVCPSSTAVSPTSEESPQFPVPPPSSVVGRLRIGRGVKQTTIVGKRTRGKSIQRG